MKYQIRRLFLTPKNVRCGVCGKNINECKYVIDRLGYEGFVMKTFFIHENCIQKWQRIIKKAKKKAKRLSKKD